MEFFRGSYGRFRVPGSTAPIPFVVESGPSLQPLHARIRVAKVQYGVLKTHRGFVLVCEPGDGFEVDHVLFEDGSTRQLSAREVNAMINESRSPDDPHHVLALVQLVLLRTLGKLLSGHHLIHGAALCFEGRGLALPGASGQGKTTLALALAQRGLAFLSDDVACLNLASRYLEPFPRSVNLRRPRRSEPSAIAEMNPKWMGPVDMEELVPGSMGEKCPLRYLFFLSGGIQATARLRPIPTRAAVWQLLELSHTPIDGPLAQLWRLVPVLREVQCFELEVGGVDETASLIHEIVAEGNMRCMRR